MLGGPSRTAEGCREGAGVEEAWGTGHWRGTHEWLGFGVTGLGARCEAGVTLGSGGCSRLPEIPIPITHSLVPRSTRGDLGP